MNVHNTIFVSRCTVPGMLKAVVKCTQVISSENQSSLHDAVTNKAWSDANIRERVKPRYSIGSDSAS